MSKTALGTRQYAIIALTVITALIHLGLGITSGGGFGIAFILNGIGYLALIAALYFLPQFAAQRALVRWALLGFTAVTFVLYFVFNGAAAFDSIVGLLTKVVELALIVLLWMEK